jgi:hypothetical protein
LLVILLHVKQHGGLTCILFFITSNCTVEHSFPEWFTLWGAGDWSGQYLPW